MKFSLFHDSRQGGRRQNEDHVGYCYSREALLMVVADGMGGHLHGELGSQFAVQFLTEAFRREAQPRLRDPSLFLRKGIEGAHQGLVDFRRERRLAETPHTTCVACVVQDSMAWWAHAGDSRLYHVRGGRILAQTNDHSVVQTLINQGRIREEAVAAHPDRNKVFNCLGSANPPHVDLSEQNPLEHGDTLLACTDGLWGPLTSRVIVTGLIGKDIMTAAPALLEQAERRAGKDSDNLSVVAMTWSETHHAQAPGEVSTLVLEPGLFASGDRGA